MTDRHKARRPRRGDGATADHVYQLLRNQILGGHLGPGERLVERSIGEAVAASRTPVREALHKLEMVGLVETTSRGVVVAEITTDELMNLCAVRETLEGMAARLAAVRRSEAEAAALDHLVSAMQECLETGDPSQLVPLNYQLHTTIWGIARNPPLAEMLELLRYRIGSIQDGTSTAVERRDDAFEEHRLIAQAIIDRDSAVAERLTLQHWSSVTAARIATRLGDDQRPGNEGPTASPE